MSRVRFLIFPRKKVDIRGREHLDRARIFWQVVPVQQPVQYGRDGAHISWAVWEQIPLEDCMEERQHHLTESSSARLRRSQKLEILLSPNSKSLGAYIFHEAQRFQRPPCSCRILWGANILDEAHIFYICADILDRREYFRCKQIFWMEADILDMRRHFKMCAYILIGSKYFVCAQIFWDVRIYFDWKRIFYV